jgi:hypothetical protein
MCLRFAFLLITRMTSWLRLSRRKESWKTAEILLLRHHLAVLQRQQPRRPNLNWADRVLLATLSRDTESPPPWAAAADHPRHDPALAPRHRPPPLGRQVHPRQDRQADNPQERQGTGAPARPREPALVLRPTLTGQDQ